MTTTPLKLYAAKITPLLLCALLLCAVGAAAASEPQPLSAIPSIKDTGGTLFTDDDLDDQFTLLVFFSMYSDATPDVFKYLSEMRKKAPFKNSLRIIAVNVDPDSGQLDAYVKKNKIPFRVLMDLSLDLSNKLSIKTPPSIFLIDPDHNLRISARGLKPDSLPQIEAKTADAISYGTASSKKSNADKPDAKDKEFMDKKMIAVRTRFYKFCRDNENLLLYVTEDNSLFIFNIKDMSRKMVTSDASSADWSPDCSSVVFASKEKSGVWIKPLDGSAEQIANEGRYPQWSPRGNFIAFMASNDVWVYHITPKKRWQLAADMKSFHWSPDGRLILLSDSKGKLWLVSPFSKASLLEKIFK